jgi:hypothetical protein
MTDSRISIAIQVLLMSLKLSRHMSAWERYRANSTPRRACAGDDSGAPALPYKCVIQFTEC